MTRPPVGTLAIVTFTVSVLAVALAADPGSSAGPTTGKRDVIVIGHRGASGSRPEHTLASYRLAIKQCADSLLLYSQR